MTTAPASRARRRAVLAAGTAIAALTLSGCNMTGLNPTTTMLRYAPADGVEADGETIVVRDLLVVSHGNGAPGIVSGSIVNRTAEPVTVTVSANGTALSPEVTVEPNSRARLDGTGADGGEGEGVTIPALDTPAGQSIEIRLSTDEETLSATTPVLLPQGQYSQYADEAGGTVEPHPTGDDDH